MKTTVRYFVMTLAMLLAGNPIAFASHTSRTPDADTVTYNIKYLECLGLYHEPGHSLVVIKNVSKDEIGGAMRYSFSGSTTVSRTLAPGQTDTLRLKDGNYYVSAATVGGAKWAGSGRMTFDRGVYSLCGFGIPYTDADIDTSTMGILLMQALYADVDRTILFLRETTRQAAKEFSLLRDDARTDSDLQRLLDETVGRWNSTLAAEFGEGLFETTHEDNVIVLTLNGFHSLLPTPKKDDILALSGTVFMMRFAALTGMDVRVDFADIFSGRLVNQVPISNSELLEALDE